MKRIRIREVIAMPTAKPLFRGFAAFVPAERDDVAKSAKLVALNLENNKVTAHEEQ